MSDFQLLREEVVNGVEGKNIGPSMGFRRLSKYISIRKRIFTVIFGSTGTGKTALCDSAYILNPFNWVNSNKNKTDIKVKWIVFSQERSKRYKLAKWVSLQMFLSRGVLIPISKLLGWWEEKISKDDFAYFEMCEPYIDSLLQSVDIIDGANNPTGIYKYVKNYAETHGKIEVISEYNKIYRPDNPNEIVIPIIDHLGLMKTEKGMSKKEAIDRTSEYMQFFRDFYGYSPVAVMQLNRDASNPIYSKMDSFEPNLDMAKESGTPIEAADNVISIFEPLRFRTKNLSYDAEAFVNQETGERHFRSISILKNSYGESDISIGMAMQGATGYFKELPRPKDMEHFSYQSVFDGSYFLDNN